MSEHKIKREMRILGWTKASHKSAVRYFSNEREDRPFRSLKKKKKCRFNKGVHVYERHEKDFFKLGNWAEGRQQVKFSCIVFGC